MSWDGSHRYNTPHWGLLVGAVLGAVIVLSLLGLAFNWFGAVVERAGPQNVAEQWRFAYDYDESLRAIARQVCSAGDSLDAAQGDEEQTARRSQLLAYQQNYDRVRAEYDARLRDAFRAGIIRPGDVPERAPTLERMKREEC